MYIYIYKHCSINMFGAMRRSLRRSLPRSLRAIEQPKVVAKVSYFSKGSVLSSSIGANPKVFANVVAKAFAMHTEHMMDDPSKYEQYETS